jgi:hypothetical protein
LTLFFTYFLLPVRIEENGRKCLSRRKYGKFMRETIPPGRERGVPLKWLNRLRQLPGGPDSILIYLEAIIKNKLLMIDQRSTAI